MAVITDEIIIKVSIAKEQAAAAFASIKANISKIGTTIKKVAKASLAFGAALSSIFAIARGGALAFSFLNKIPGIALRGSKSLALIAGSTQLISKGAIQSKKGIDKLNQALSTITGRELALTPGKLKQIGRAAISATQGVFLLRTGIGSLRKGFGPLGKIIGGITKRIFSMRTAFLVLAGIGGILGLGNSLVFAASQMEDFRTRFIALTKSTDEAQKKIAFLSAFAGKVPFELPDIIKAGISLEAFGLKAEKGIKPLADLAAFMGTSIVDAASAMGRAFAAGAGAADILREKGVLNLIKMRLGIEDLSKLTLPEFRKAMIDTFTDVTGKVAGATKLLAETLTGQTSMMTDAIFQLRVVIGEQLMPKIKELMTKRITPLIKKYTEWIKTNKDLIALKFAQFVDDSIIKMQEFVKWAKEAAIETRKWWEENKELLFTLVKFAIAAEIAIKISALVIAITGLGKVLLAAKVFISGFLLTLVGAGGLFAAVTALSPQILVLGGAIALLLTYKLGEWLADITSKLISMSKEMKEIIAKTEAFGKEQATILKEISERTGVLVTTWKELDVAVDAGILRFSRAANTWIKAAEKAKGTLEDMGEEGKNAAKKIKSAWEKMAEGVKKAFETLGVTSKQQFEQQVRDQVKAFETIASEQELSDQEVLRLRETLFANLKTLADEAGEKGVLGLDVEDFKTRLAEAHQFVLSQSVGTAKSIGTVGDTTFLFFKGFLKDAKTLVETAKAEIEVLIEDTGNQQVSSFSSMIDEIDRYKSAYITAEEAITDVVVIEVEKRFNILQRFVEDAGKLRREAGAFGLPISGITPVTPVAEESFARGIDRVPHDMIARIHKDERIIPASQNRQNTTNADNRKYEIHLHDSNARGGIGVEDEFALEQMLRNLSRFDASL